MIFTIITIVKHEEWLSRGVKNVIGLKRPVPYEVNLQESEWFINLVQFFNSSKLSNVLLRDFLSATSTGGLYPPLIRLPFCFG